MSLEKYATDIERALVRAIVEDALAQGYTITVHDGVGTPCRRSVVAADVYAAMASTGEDVLFFHKQGAPGRQWVLLVYGNGAELLTDSTDYPETETILARAVRLAEVAA